MFTVLYFYVFPVFYAFLVVVVSEYLQEPLVHNFLPMKVTFIVEYMKKTSSVFKISLGVTLTRLGALENSK